MCHKTKPNQTKPNQAKSFRSSALEPHNSIQGTSGGVMVSKVD